ncbi:Ig-specific serine endopeptidase MIP [Mycoplasma crocodyli]|uniref:Lipoprotein n=1 Tax=Mycoplasma crocodyli (strain ATCC 51981 / MP145) TaxID=512564 RepID=D5E629_MYCCM|nr:DUF31 family protein [Mycoplasma crocodyli]ADE19379.1 lipoprotein [Mycoplasma crocodyli MP145]
MRKAKKIIVSLVVAMNIGIGTVSLVSCNNDNLKLEKDDKKNKENNLEKKFDFKNLDINVEYKGAEPVGAKYANETLTSDYKAIIPEEYKDKVDVKVVGLQNPNALNGTLEVHYELIDKTNPKNKIEKTQIIKGFLTNPFGVFRNGDISGNNKLDVGDKTAYISKSNLDRFNFDNSNYLPKITPRGDFKPAFEYVENSFTNNFLSTLDEKAKGKMQETYTNAKYKGFSIPYLDKDGKAIALNVNEGTEVGKGPSLVDAYSDEQYSLGLARTLPNEKYKKIALQTFSIYISTPGVGEEKGVATYGTSWILDYQLPENGKYPTKWYIGTNLHVSQYMNLPNEPIYNTRSNTKKTTTIQFNRLTPNAGIRTKFRTTAYGETFENWAFDTTNSKGESPFRTVYAGLNFLKTSPKDYLPESSSLRDTEEMIDFAVIEIDFEKFDLSRVDVWTADKKVPKDYKTAEDLARDMTNGYAEHPENHIKFIRNSYLKDYDRINIPLINNPIDPNFKENKKLTEYDSLFALGYPMTASGNFVDHFLDLYQDAADLEAGPRSVSLWVNGRRKWYGNLVESETSDKKINEDILNAGNYLSYELGYRTFVNKPGIQDAMIGNPINGVKPFEYFAREDKIGELPENIGNPTKPEGFRNRYLGYGINYLLRHYSPGGGASGTSVRNQDNEMVGIVHVANWSALTSLTAAFRSEGVDYGDYYGPYKMEQYDLIYGGGENQRLSYREALKELYKDKNVKTNLFKNGLEKEQIPDEFKFNNVQKIDPSK